MNGMPRNRFETTFVISRELNFCPFCFARTHFTARPGTLRRAVKCVLAKQKGQKFNSLEITKVVSKRFLGIPFMSVTGHSRHIQQGVGLVSAKDFVLRMLAAEAPESALGSGGERHHGEVATKQYVALTSSS